MSDINFGQIEEALNNKVDLDFRNIDATKMDIVIEYQEPSELNNYTWYRLYASGWVEQGGMGPLVAPSAQATINFPIAMIDANYTILFGESNAGAKIVAAITRTNNSVTVESYAVTGTANVLVSWCVCGKANMTGHEILPSLYPKHEEEAWEHRVISFQKPTVENNYTWYRLYADGWVEQGGRVLNTTAGYQVTLPIVMSDANYTVITTGTSSVNSQPSDTNTANRNTAFNYSKIAYDMKITGFKVGNSNEMSQNGFCWQVSGIAATN